MDDLFLTCMAVGGTFTTKLEHRSALVLDGDSFTWSWDNDTGTVHFCKVTPVDRDQGLLNGAWVTRFDVRPGEMTIVSFPPSFSSAAPTRTYHMYVSKYVARVQITMEFEPMVLEPGVRSEFLRPCR